MNAIASAYLDKAARLLNDADTMLRAGLNEAAGRNAYLAGFHAAQACIAVTGERIPRTHHGVHGPFFALTQEGSGFSAEQRVFLSKAYMLKAIADYETGPDSEVPFEKAQDAVESAHAFVEKIEAWLETGKP